MRSPRSPAVLYARHRTGITRALYTALLTSFGVRLYWNLRPARQDSGVQGKGGNRRAAVDYIFIRRLLTLLRIAFPKLISTSSVLVVAQALLLVARTLLSLQVAKLDGRITAALVQGKGLLFLRSVALWMALGLPASCTNAAIQYVQRMLALRIRSQLTTFAENRYLSTSPSSNTPIYYALQQHGTNVGQLVAADISKFSASLAKLYANLTKPLLDVCIYTYQLGQSIGSDNVFLLGLAIQLSARALRLAAPPFGEFVAAEAELEGDFRSAHSRLEEYSEEVALLNGYVPEKRGLDRRFYALVHHIRRTLKHRLAYQALENFVVKYWWGAAGLASCALPVFSKMRPSITAANRAEVFIVNRRLLLLSSDAMGRIMASYKDISALAGITARVSEFLQKVDSLNDDDTSIVEKRHSNITVDDYIEFDHVSVVSPSKEVLIKDLNIRINQGDHLLIVGPNGSGKSSLFRVLGGLWTPNSGRIVRPSNRDVFYIPQRPYLSRGSLRQQIIYPASEHENTASDEQLLEILDILGLGTLVQSMGGLDAVREWREDLSTGAQQKIAAARLFYHRPKFAILDECTASVTLDTETIIYTHAQRLGITLLTVSHRASLWKYHNKILQLDGQGGYLFANLDPTRRLALEEEKLKIDDQLRQVNSVRERLAVLKQERRRWSASTPHGAIKD